MVKREVEFVMVGVYCLKMIRGEKMLFIRGIVYCLVWFEYKYKMGEFERLNLIKLE